MPSPCGRRAGRRLLFLHTEHDANRRCVRRRRVATWWWRGCDAAAGARTAGLVGPAMAHKSGAATRFFDSLRRPACRPGLLGTFRRRPTPTALKLELYYNITCRLAGVRAAPSVLSADKRRLPFTCCVLCCAARAPFTCVFSSIRCTGGSSRTRTST